MKRNLAVLGALLWMSQGHAGAGEPRQIQLSWDQLQSRIEGRKVALTLPDGTSIAGKARAVEPEGLRLKISKTTDRKVQPKGVRLIPRQSVTYLEVTEYRWIGRLLGTAGAMGAALGIVAAQQIDLYEGALVVAVPAGIAAGTIGVGIGGYYIGKRCDKRVTGIRIAR